MRRPVFFRHAEPPPYTRPVHPAQDFQSVWVRARGRVPADAVLEAAVLAYVSDMSILEPVFRATGSARHAPGGRALGTGEFFDDTGRHVASVSQLALVKVG